MTMYREETHFTYKSIASANRLLLMALSITSSTSRHCALPSHISPEPLLHDVSPKAAPLVTLKWKQLNVFNLNFDRYSR